MAEKTTTTAADKGEVAETAIAVAGKKKTSPAGTKKKKTTTPVGKTTNPPKTKTNPPKKTVTTTAVEKIDDSAILRDINDIVKKVTDTTTDPPSDKRRETIDAECSTEKKKERYIEGTEKQMANLCRSMSKYVNNDLRGFVVSGFGKLDKLQGDLDYARHLTPKRKSAAEIKKAKRVRVGVGRQLRRSKVKKVVAEEKDSNPKPTTTTTVEDSPKRRGRPRRAQATAVTRKRVSPASTTTRPNKKKKTAAATTTTPVGRPKSK